MEALTPRQSQILETVEQVGFDLLEGKRSS